jgi:hypothetical protein
VFKILLRLFSSKAETVPIPATSAASLNSSKPEKYYIPFDSDPDAFRHFLTDEQLSLYRSEAQIRADIKFNPLHQWPEVLKRGHLMPEETGHKFDDRNQPIGVGGHTNPFVDRG